MLFEGTRFIQNLPLEAGGNNIRKKELYTYEFPKPRIRFSIELDYYDHKIVVISFYRKGAGRDERKYRLRFKDTSPLVTRNVFKACLSIYKTINRNNDYALFYHAADDLDDYKETNDRFHAYEVFYRHYFPELPQYKQIGSTALNIKGIYHSEFYQTADKILTFFQWFSNEVQTLMNEDR